jgi:error-prone DNA polymerase
VITDAHLRGEEKGRPVYDLYQVVEELRDHCVALTGCRKGAVRQALTATGPHTAATEVIRRCLDVCPPRPTEQPP